MRSIFLISIIFVIVSFMTARATAADIYIAPDGNDSNSGTIDQPLATLDRAVRDARKLRNDEPDRETSIVIQLRNGTYCLDRTFRLTPEDSGTEKSPLIIEAYPGETPIVSGGRLLTGWTTGKDGRLSVVIPEVADGKERVSQLYVGDQRRYRPTFPRKGYYFVEAPVAGTQLWSTDRFRFKEGDLQANWHNLQDVEMVAFHKWSISRIPIQSIDDEKRICQLAGSTWNPKISPIDRDTWYRVENVREALDQPGQWYLERKSGQVTYIPVPGETAETIQAVAPLLSTIVSIQGNPNGESKVEHIVFRGITFAHTGWNNNNRGYSAFQAEKTLDGAITMNYADHISVEDCIVRNTGNYGMQIGVGCFYITVEGCEFFDLGAGGIRVGSDRFNEEPDQKKWSGHCTIRDNLVAHGGRVHPGAVGIWIAHAHDCTVTHNHIHDLYYSGISVGWCWATGFSPAVRNTISHNLIHDIGHGVLSDMGGIYTLGKSPGTTLRYNRIDNVRRARYGGWGIYFDANSGEIVADNNIVSRTEDGGLHQHFGTDNVVRNNIFAYAENTQLQITNVKKSGKLTLEGNIWYWNQGELFGKKLDDEIFFARNLYWDASGAGIDFPMGASEAQWRERENDFVVGDPKFTDPQQGDFTIQPGSAAERIGFKPIDISTVGRLTKTDRTLQLPPVPHAFQPAPPEPSFTMIEDFENLWTDRALPGWGQIAASSEENIRVVDERAASGRQSLKFNDGPGGAVYFPHLYRNMTFEKGTIFAAFDLYAQAGSHMQFEWRDDTPWYTPGPSVEVMPDGTLTASGEKLLTIPHEKWIRIEMICPVGPDSTGKYLVCVTLPDEQPREFKDIEYPKGFETVGWFGFACLSKDRVAFFIDNFTIRQLEQKSPK